MKFLLTIVFCLATACISQQDLTPERCGSVPTMAQAEWGVNYCVQNIGLKDPGSAQVRNIEIGGMHGQVNIHGNVYGWLVTFELNAKNSYGGYNGFKHMEVIMMDGGTRVWFSGYIPE